MGTIRKDFRYKVVKNLLSKEEVSLAHDYCRIRNRLNVNQFEGGLSNHQDTSIYGDPFTESLMLNKKKIMEENTGLELLPTYSYWRMYTYGSCSNPHKDRNSCEISVTISIGSSSEKPWPIYIGEKAINLNHGDGVIYLGIEDEHSRKELDTDYHAQCFLHYVDKNGPNKMFVKDKRQLYGMPYNAN